MLDALSTILIRGNNSNEVAAVVAKPYASDGLVKLQVIASVVFPSNAESLVPPTATSTNPGFWSPFFDAPNPHKDKIHGHADSPINKSSFPLIRDDDIPEELTAVLGSGRLLKVFLKTQW